MKIFQVGERRGRKRFFWGAAFFLAVAGMGAEGILAAEDSAYISETEKSSPESAYFREDMASAQEKAEKAASVKEEMAGKAVQGFVSAVRTFSVRSREDTEELLKLENMYAALSEEEQNQVSDETMMLLKEFEEKAGTYNRIDNDVSISGDLPWYIQFFAAELPGEGQVDENTWSVVPYEMELRDARTGEEYTLPKGKSVTISMPVPDTAYRGQFVIYHHKSDGSVEKIVPKIAGGTMSFEATSFSLYTIAGSTVVAGIGITTVFNLSDEGGKNEPSDNSTSKEQESENASEKIPENEDKKSETNAGIGSDESAGAKANAGTNGMSQSSTEKNSVIGESSSVSGETAETPAVENVTEKMESSSEIGDTEGTPQADPSEPLQASPAQTGDENHVAFLVALLIFSGSVVMKRRGVYRSR